MRRIIFNLNVLSAGAAAAIAVGLVGCKEDDLESTELGLVPPVGVPVGAGPGDSTAVPLANAGGFGTAPSVLPSEFGLAPTGAPSDGTAVSPDSVAAVDLDIPTVPYVIQKGDTLSQIAKNNGTNVRTLQLLNGIKGEFIRYGQQIKVPAPATATPPDVSPAPTGLGPAPAPVTPPIGTPPPSVPAVTPPTPAPGPSLAPPGGTGVGGASSGFGFGGDSVPRPRTPPRDSSVPVAPLPN